MPVFHGSDGVALTGQIRPSGISRIWTLPERSAEETVLVAELRGRNLVQLMDLRAVGGGPADRSAAESTGGASSTYSSGEGEVKGDAEANPFAHKPSLSEQPSPTS